MAACSTATQKEDQKPIATEKPITKVTKQHRPHFHFTPPSKWMNDPNGMVYYEGEYHLFYQHYPDSTVWGPMHWGHAVSTDLVTWEHLPIALYPDSLGLIFSGSAVIDWKNTSGLGENGQPPMVAIYTYHLMEGEKTGKHDFQTQGIAYSNDKGRTWTKYEGNPVIPNTENIHDFRDPKVSWHEATQQWTMILAANDKVKIYNSKNLKDWTHTSDFGLGIGSQARPWECPDLFELPLEDGSSKWVMIVSIGNRLEDIQAPNGGSGTQYFVGDFDGKTFTLDSKFAEDVKDGNALWIDYGTDNYAGVTWSDIPKEDGRRLFMGWMSNWLYAQIVPTESWRSAMTIARTLHLKSTDDGLRLFSKPVKEMESLRGKSYNIPANTLAETLGLTEKLGFSPTTSELQLEFTMSPNSKADFGVELSNSKGEKVRIGFDAASNQFYSDRRESGKTDFSEHFAAKKHLAPRIAAGNVVKMQVFVDVASAELFADDGATVMTDIFFPNENFMQLKVFSSGKGVRLNKGKVWELK